MNEHPHASARADDPWTSQAVLADLGTACIGSELHLYAGATSTNDLAIQHGMSGGREGAIFLAETQSAGRGRSGRVWHSPPGCAIYCSILLLPGAQSGNPGPFSLLAGGALAEGISACGPFPVRVKWPNDLMLDGRKVGGILCELAQGTEGGRFLVLGFGINVRPPPSGWPAEIASRAAALVDAGRPWAPRAAILRACLRRLDHWYARYHAGEVGAICDLWRRYSATLGQQVEVVCGSQRLRGVARDIDMDGAMLIETADGKTERILTGDVESLQMTEPT